MRYALAIRLAFAAAATSLAPGVAEACGGCFAPPESQQVVTDHRMVMAVHSNESILWDQIRYTGRPEDFSWVLPVAGTVQIELASDAFFDMLELLTVPRVSSPNNTCPGRSSLQTTGGQSAGGGGSSNVETVTVLQQAIVGPYATVVLRSENADSLTTWLRENRYAVPPSVEPVIRSYVELHMDFVALRLLPGEGVQAMQPVRVRFQSANMVLPLRMVAAGIGDSVGIVLWVIGNGRYEAANFGNAEIDPTKLVWDWPTNRSNYREVFDSTIQATSSGRSWITEASWSAGWLTQRFPANPPPDAGGDDAGTAMPSPAEDWRIASNNHAEGIWLTRLRTVLAKRFLDSDLQLQARSNVGVQSWLQATQATGDPCGRAVGGGGGGCSVQPHDPVRREAPSPLRMAWLLALVGAAMRSLARSRGMGGRDHP